MQVSQLTAEQHAQLEAMIRHAKSRAREIRRAQAILLVDQGEGSDVIHRLTGYRERYVARLHQLVLTDGIDVIRDEPSPQPKKLLTKRQQEAVMRVVKNTTPADWEAIGAHVAWSPESVGAYIRQQFNVEYDAKTAYYLLYRGARFLHRIKPRVYANRSEQQVKKWREQTRRQLSAVWNDPLSVILAEDEMVFSVHTTVQKLWVYPDRAPGLDTSVVKSSRYVYGFLNLKTGQEHAFKAEAQTTLQTQCMLSHIRQYYPTQKLVILWDTAWWHRGTSVQEAVRQDSCLDMIYFPAYGREENPQDRVWTAGYHHLSPDRFAADIDHATDDLIDYLNATQFVYPFLGLG